MVQSKDTIVRYELPRYKYDFNYDKFKDSLINLGLTNMFGNADLTGMLTSSSKLNLFVSQAIHKSHIEVSEDGTKASAATVIIISKNAMVKEQEKVKEVVFNRPFMYIIKEKNSDNVWFTGVVYEPEKWDDSKTNGCVSK